MSEALRHAAPLAPNSETFDYNAFPYDQLTAESLHAIGAEARSRCDQFVEQIISAEELTCDTVLAPLHEARDALIVSSAQAEFMCMLHPEQEVREAAADEMVQLRNHESDLAYHDQLYGAINAYAETADAGGLTGEYARFLEKTVREFRRAGQGLPQEKRDRLQELNHQITKREITFGRNLAEEKTTIELSEAELAGTSDKLKRTFERNPETGAYIVGMDQPTYLSFMKQVASREARRKMEAAFRSRAKDVNAPILDEVIQMREEAAGLLGVPSWAHHVLEEQMAKTPGTVMAFYDELIEPLKDKGRQEMAAMTQLLITDGYEGPLQRYDEEYYKARLAARDYGIDEEEVAEYFPMSVVQEGIFEFTGETFELSYRQIDVPTWHPDVMVYAVDDSESGEELAHIYMDLYPREGKFTSACAGGLTPGRRMPDGTKRLPQVGIVANYTKPTENEPSLMMPRERWTKHHEFGHALNEALARAELVIFAGLRGETDFIEAPSQIMENWVWEPEMIRKYSRHYKTGEPMPDEMIERLVAFQDLNTALYALRQFTLGIFDMRVHDASDHRDIPAIWEEASAVGLFPVQEGTNFPATFQHILGEYAAGYYGYQWAKVISDDMYHSRFKPEGITNPEVGKDYRRDVLEPGGSVDGIDMARNFLGREFNNQAFLRKLGVEVKPSQEN